MIPLLFAAALQSEIVLQTNVIEKFSCGAGCHKKVEQLTNMVDIGDGWRKIKVKRTPYMWTREGGLEQRAPVFDSPIGMVELQVGTIPTARQIFLLIDVENILLLHLHQMQIVVKET